MGTNGENTLFSILGKLTDSLILDFIFLISCLPVITIGASCTAFYYTMHKVLRRDRGYLWSEYKRSWKENFKQATVCWLIFLGIAAVLCTDIYVMYQMFRAGSSFGSAYVLFVILLAVLILWAVYTFAAIARFENTTRELLKVSAWIMIAHLPKTLAVLGILAVSAFVIWAVPLLALIVPMLAVWFIELILESIFIGYMSEEDQKEEIRQKEES